MGEDAFLGAVEAGRVLDRHRRARRRRQPAAARPASAAPARRRPRSCGRAPARRRWPSALAAAAPWLRDSCTMRRSISTKLPEIGRFDHVASGVTWNSTSVPLSRRVAGDQRRAVGEARPGALDDVGRRLGQHLPRRPSPRSAAAGRRTGRSAGNSVDRLRRRPGQRAAQRALAEAQPHRQQVLVIAGGGKPRAGEAHQRAAVLRPSRSAACARLSGMVPTSAMTIIAGFCSSSCGIASARSGLGGSTEIGEGLQRAADVVERRQQRLRLVGLATATAGRRGGAWSFRRARARRRPAARRRCAIEAKSLRSSNGTAISPVPAVSPGPKVMVASAMRRPLSSKAPAVTWRGAGSPGARMAVRAKPSTSFSAAVRPTMSSRSGTAQTHVRRIAGRAASRRRPRRRARPARRRARRRVAPGSVVERGGDAGIDRRRGRPAPGAARRRCSRSSAAAASNGPISALGFSAVKARTTGTPVALASAISRSAVATRRSQSARARPAIVDDQRQRRAAGRQPLARVEDRLGQRQHDQRRHQQAEQRQPPRALVRRLLASSARGRGSSAAGRLPSAASAASAAAATRSPAAPAGPTGSAGKPKASGSQLMRGHPRRSRRRRSSPCGRAPAPRRPAGRCG